MGDIGRDGVEAFFHVAPGSAYLGLLRSLRGEVGVLNFKREGAEDLGTVPAGNSTDE
jgi:hypothetical protein